MKRSLIYSVFLLILMSSCNRLSNDFFEFLFNTKGISLEIDCSNKPSFGEGRSFEIYSISEVDLNSILQNILNKSKFVKIDKYTRYKTPEWYKTPINRTETVYSFIHSEMSDEIVTCFNEENLIQILEQESNYYTFLYDNLGRVKLFILDTKKKKLFLLTSYEL